MSFGVVIEQLDRVLPIDEPMIHEPFRELKILHSCLRLVIELWQLYA